MEKGGSVVKYQIGMLGGSFDPLHIGHINNIIKAASQCVELYVVISWCKHRETVSPKQIYRWIHQSTLHLDNVRIITVEDNAPTKEHYSRDNHWEQGAVDIKKSIGKNIDVVFCGSDYQGSGIFEKLYSNSEIVYFERSEIDISSSKIRENPLKHWQYIPKVSRGHYGKRVLVIGSESTGKSTLTRNLSLAYNTSYVEEIGREVCYLAGGEDYMNLEDLMINIIRQKDKEIKALENCNRLLFVDTDAITTQFYGEFLLTDKEEIEKCNNLAKAVSALSRFDLVLFLEPTVEFVQDGTRNQKIADSRQLYSNKLKSLFIKENIDFVSLDGDYLERFTKAKEIINSRFNIRE